MSDIRSRMGHRLDLPGAFLGNDSIRQRMNGQPEKTGSARRAFNRLTHRTICPQRDSWTGRSPLSAAACAHGNPEEYFQDCRARVAQQYVSQVLALAATPGVLLTACDRRRLP
jgi:hypothetical protein